MLCAVGAPWGGRACALTRARLGGGQYRWHGPTWRVHAQSIHRVLDSGTSLALEQRVTMRRALLQMSSSAASSSSPSPSLPDTMTPEVEEVVDYRQTARLARDDAAETSRRRISNAGVAEAVPIPEVVTVKDIRRREVAAAKEAWEEHEKIHRAVSSRGMSPRQGGGLLRTGALTKERLPNVRSAAEIADSAAKRAHRIGPSKQAVRSSNTKIRERSRTVQQLDELTKQLTAPLNLAVRGFPARRMLHPYEAAVVDLTLGEGAYEARLKRVEAIRKRITNVGKELVREANNVDSGKNAMEARLEGFNRLEGMLKTRNAILALDELKAMAKTLKNLPVVETDVPTLALVGAPNVGKSTIVRALSSGKPEVNAYPFTTRGIVMGHTKVDGVRYQVTDTPGLLPREDHARNAIELLTLVSLQYLPTAVLFVMDCSERCGTSVADQVKVAEELRARFPDRPWLHVYSKWDLPRPAGEDTDPPPPPGNPLRPPIHVSMETGEGLVELKEAVEDTLRKWRPDGQEDAAFYTTSDNVLLEELHERIPDEMAAAEEEEEGEEAKEEENKN